MRWLIGFCLVAALIVAQPTQAQAGPGPTRPIVHPVYPPHHMPGWDWWRIYPYRPYYPVFVPYVVPYPVPAPYPYYVPQAGENISQPPAPPPIPPLPAAVTGR